MPYANLPKSQWGKMDRCVEKVKARDGKKVNAYAVCYSSIAGGSIKKAAKKRGGK